MPNNSSSDDGGPKSQKSITIRNRKELDNVFEEERYRSIIDDVKAYIACQGPRYGVPVSLQPDEILSTVFIRVTQQLTKKAVIYKLVGCLNLTALHVIQETGRKHQGRKDLAKLLKAEAANQGEIELPDSFEMPTSPSIFQTLQPLSAIEKRICYYRDILEFSWRDVCIELAKEGFLDRQTCTNPKVVNTISRRGRRALEKLKAHYEQFPDTT